MYIVLAGWRAHAAPKPSDLGRVWPKWLICSLGLCAIHCHPLPRLHIDSACIVLLYNQDYFYVRVERLSLTWSSCAENTQVSKDAPAHRTFIIPRMFIENCPGAHQTTSLMLSGQPPVWICELKYNSQQRSKIFATSYKAQAGWIQLNQYIL